MSEMTGNDRKMTGNDRKMTEMTGFSGSRKNPFLGMVKSKQIHTKPNQKPYLTKPNQTKPNRTKPNQTKPNQTKPHFGALHARVF